MKRLRVLLLMRVRSRIWLRSVTTLVLLSTCMAALFPRPALAACGALDVGACVDAAEYSFYYGIASINTFAKIDVEDMRLL